MKEAKDEISELLESSRSDVIRCIQVKKEREDELKVFRDRYLPLSQQNVKYLLLNKWVSDLNYLWLSLIEINDLDGRGGRKIEFKLIELLDRKCFANLLCWSRWFSSNFSIDGKCLWGGRGVGFFRPFWLYSKFLVLLPVSIMWFLT